MQDAIHAIEAQGDAVRTLKDDMKTKKKAKVRLVIICIILGVLRPRWIRCERRTSSPRCPPTGDWHAGARGGSCEQHVEAAEVTSVPHDATAPAAFLATASCNSCSTPLRSDLTGS